MREGLVIEGLRDRQVCPVAPYPLPETAIVCCFAKRLSNKDVGGE